jgi:hypothetical protein
VNIYIEQPLDPPDNALGRLVNVNNHNEIIATTFPGNPLREPLPDFNTIPTSRLLMYAGTLADDLFEPHPMTWMAPGHEQFNNLCDNLIEPLRAAGCTLCFQPHARHVLSDVQSTLTFLNRCADAPFEIAFDPAGLFEPSMLSDAEDHLSRSFELLGPRCAMLILRNIDLDPATHDPVAAPLTHGRLPLDLLRTLTRAHITPETPIILHEPNIKDQINHLHTRQPTAVAE